MASRMTVPVVPSSQKTDMPSCTSSSKCCWSCQPTPTCIYKVGYESLLGERSVTPSKNMHTVKLQGKSDEVKRCAPVGSFDWRTSYHTLCGWKHIPPRASYRVRWRTPFSPKILHSLSYLLLGNICISLGYMHYVLQWQHHSCFHMIRIEE